MLKSSQNIWVLEKQNTAEVAGRRRAQEAISSDSSGDKGRAMTVFVLIILELLPWCHYPIFLWLLLSCPISQHPHSSTFNHGQAGCVHETSWQDLLPSPSWALSLVRWDCWTKLPSPTWVIPSQLPASPWKPCFPYSEDSHHSPLKIKLNSPFLWPWPSRLGSPVGCKYDRKTLSNSWLRVTCGTQSLRQLCWVLQTGSQRW